MRFVLLLLLPIFSFAQNGLVTIKLGGSPLSSSAWNLNGNSIVDSTFIGTTNSKDLVFKTKNTEAMRIDTNGNVGIGLASPNYKLHIDGGYVGIDGCNGLLLRSYSNPNTEKAQFLYCDSMLEINAYGRGTYIGLGLGIGSLPAKDSIPENGLYVEGKTGIGTATPTAKLHVNGDVRIEGTDSVTIYAKTPANGTFEYCTNCSGNGITGRLLGYIGSAWRRFTIE